MCEFRLNLAPISGNLFNPNSLSLFSCFKRADFDEGCCRRELRKRCCWLILNPTVHGTAINYRGGARFLGRPPWVVNVVVSSVVSSVVCLCLVFGWLKDIISLFLFSLNIVCFFKIFIFEAGEIDLPAEQFLCIFEKKNLFFVNDGQIWHSLNLYETWGLIWPTKNELSRNYSLSEILFFEGF